MECKGIPRQFLHKYRILGRRVASESEIAKFHDVQSTHLAAKKYAYPQLSPYRHPVYSEASSQKGRNSFHPVSECRHFLEFVRFPLALFLSSLLSSGGYYYPGGSGILFGIALVPERTVLTGFLVETCGTYTCLAAGTALWLLTIGTLDYPGSVFIELEVRSNIFCLTPFLSIFEPLYAPSAAIVTSS